MRDANKNKAEIKYAIEKVLKDEKNRVITVEIQKPIKKRIFKDEEIMCATTPPGHEA